MLRMNMLCQACSVIKRDRQAIFLICASIYILHKDILTLQIPSMRSYNSIELFTLERTIIDSPPNIIL